MTYLLTIQYDGRRYHGYQVQKNGLSIQEVLTAAARTVFGCPCAITGCSRTDSGVHALDFKATLRPDRDVTIPVDKVAVALNTVLPEDVAVLSSVEVSDTFHPRYDVTEKEYTYLIHNAPTRDPFLVGYAYHYPRKLNVSLMNEAAKAFLGTHDFSSFMAAGSKITDPTRTIYDCRVEEEGTKIKVTVRGNGFLYHMVRILVGTLIAVSEGKIDVSDLPSILSARDRSRAGSTAPACGLYLSHVSYEERRERYE